MCRMGKPFISEELAHFVVTVHPMTSNTLRNAQKPWKCSSSHSIVVTDVSKQVHISKETFQGRP